MIFKVGGESKPEVLGQSDLKSVVLFFSENQLFKT